MSTLNYFQESDDNLKCGKKGETPVTLVEK